MTKIMGQFDLPPHKPEKPKFCKHCGRPVRETLGKSGYCKKCISKAKEVTPLTNRTHRDMITLE